MKTWWVAVNTDFGGVAPDGPLGTQSAHPRAYGTFARILGRYARDQKLFPLEFAVHKMTALAAQRVGLSDRGLLKSGLAADITVFDPATVADKATFERSEEHTSELQSRLHLVCRLLLEKKKKKHQYVRHCAH